MAYVDQPGTAEQDKLNAQSPLNQPPTTGSAVGSGAGDKTPNQPSSSVAPAPFTNLGSYLAVNAPQIQGMAENVAGKLGETYNTAKGAVDTGAQGVQSAINAGYAAPNQELVNQAATNPTEFAANPENVSAFQAQYNDKYAGPTSFETTPDYTTAQGAVQSAVNEAANVGNYGGLQSYLTRNVENNPTQAMSAMDTALLNQSPEAIQTVNTAAQKMPDLNTYFANQIAAQNQNITAAQKTAAENAAAVQNRFTGEGGVVPTWQSSIGKNTSDAQAAIDTYNNQIAQVVEALGKYQPDIAAYNARDLKGRVPSIISPYTPPSPLNAITPEQAASLKDFETQDALSKLMGMNLTNLNPELKGDVGSVKFTGENPIETALSQLKREFDPTSGDLKIQELIDLLGGKVTPTTGDTNPIPINLRPPTPPPPTTPVGSTPPEPTGAYNPADSKTWTMEQHPEGTWWYAGHGWATNQNYGK
jgi:hypothetical protein